MKNKKEFIYIVGDKGPEHDSIASIHKTYEGALKAWNQLRLDLLRKAKSGLNYSQENAKKSLTEGVKANKEKLSKESIEYYEDIIKNGDEMYNRMIKALSETDPKKIDNFPHETPYILKMEVED